MTRSLSTVLRVPFRIVMPLRTARFRLAATLHMAPFDCIPTPFHIAAAAALLLACAGRAQRLEPLEFQDRPVFHAASVSLEAFGAQVGLVEVASGGAFRPVFGSTREPVIHIRFTVRNSDTDTICVPVHAMALTVPGVGIVRPIGAFFEGRQTAVGALVPPGEVGQMDVVFPVPHEVDVETMRGFRVDWAVDLPGTQLRSRTVFVALRLTDANNAPIARAFRPVAD